MTVAVQVMHGKAAPEAIEVEVPEAVKFRLREL
jgi:hypothetical protein